MFVQVEYQLEFAEWLATARNTACEAGVDAETLLHDAAAALIGAAGVHGQSTAVTDGSSLDTGFSTQQLEQLVRVYVLLSQVSVRYQRVQCASTKGPQTAAFKHWLPF